MNGYPLTTSKYIVQGKCLCNDKKKNQNFIQCLHTDGVATGLRMLRVLYPSFTATNLSVCCVCMFDKIEEGSEPYVNIFNMLGRQMKCVFGQDL